MSKPTTMRKYHLKVKYNLNETQFRNLLEKQEGLCAICRKPRGVRDFSVDHDHDTGITRGLLCVKCNTGLGLFDDSIKLLIRAAMYLDEHNKDWDR